MKRIIRLLFAAASLVLGVGCIKLMIKSAVLGADTSIHPIILGGMAVFFLMNSYVSFRKFREKQ